VYVSEGAAAAVSTAPFAPAAATLGLRPHTAPAPSPDERSNSTQRCAALPPPPPLCLTALAHPRPPCRYVEQLLTRVKKRFVAMYKDSLGKAYEYGCGAGQPASRPAMLPLPLPLPWPAPPPTSCAVASGWCAATTSLLGSPPDVCVLACVGARVGGHVALTASSLTSRRLWRA
jgi:hypothetical protein